MNATTPGPELVWTYATPTMPNVQRLQCGTCRRTAPLSGDLKHADGCAWGSGAYTRSGQAEEPLGGNQDGA